MIEDIKEVENLQISKDYFVISPYLKLPEGSYYELEEYLSIKYKNVFSKKICFIIFNVLINYEAEIFLTEFPEENDNFKYVDLAYKDLSNKSFIELDEIISYILEVEVSSVEIYLYEIDCLISTGENLIVGVYGKDKEFIEYIKELTNQQGLVFKEIIGDNWYEEHLKLVKEYENSKEYEGGE